MRRYLLITTHYLQPVAPRTYDDAWIERWAAVYNANPQIAAIGITLDMFLAQPEQLLRAAVYHELVPLPEHLDFYPLLPKQRAIRERLDAEAAGQMALNLEGAAA